MSLDRLGIGGQSRLYLNYLNAFDGLFLRHALVDSGG